MAKKKMPAPKLSGKFVKLQTPGRRRETKERCRCRPPFEAIIPPHACEKGTKFWGIAVAGTCEAVDEEKSCVEQAGRTLVTIHEYECDGRDEILGLCGFHKTGRERELEVGTCING